jgi:CO/xanthine dehydrogenase FAD-binding subunit
LPTLEFDQPSSLAEAVAALAQDGARPLAGGTDLVPQLREGRRSPRRVVDLKRIAELTAIRETADGGLSIGAAASLSSIANHPLVVDRYPAVVRAARMVGSLQIQNRASLGGNICNAAPSADGVPPLICLGAEAVVIGPGGERTVPVEAIAKGPGRTTLGEGEVLVAIRLPPPAERSAATYLRFTPRREMDIAIAGAGTWIALDAAGKVTAARIVLAAVAPVPLRAHGAEALLVGTRGDDEAFDAAAERAAAEAQPISDTRGSADYRRALVRVLTKRALAACREQIVGAAA